MKFSPLETLQHLFYGVIFWAIFGLIGNYRRFRWNHPDLGHLNVRQVLLDDDFVYFDWWFVSFGFAGLACVIAFSFVVWFLYRSCARCVEHRDDEKRVRDYRKFDMTMNA